MAYDEDLAARLDDLLQGEAGLSKKRMFGGLAFLINGNMAVAVSSQGGLLLRVDPADTELLLREPQVERFEMRGRPMKNWLWVSAGAIETDEALERWVGHGITYARSLPAK